MRAPYPSTNQDFPTSKRGSRQMAIRTTLLLSQRSIRTWMRERGLMKNSVTLSASAANC